MLRFFSCFILILISTVAHASEAKFVEIHLSCEGLKNKPNQKPYSTKFNGIISADGVKLNSFGPNELFGEASLVLKSDRTVSVVAGPSGLSAKVISSANLKKRLQKIQ